MEIRIETKDLNNAVRFYTALFGEKPVKLEAWSAHYQIKECRFLIQENTNPKFQILNFLVAQDEFLPTFIRLKSLLRSSHLQDCEVLKNNLRVSDNDGNIWVVSTDPIRGENLEEFKSASKCYLEPIFLN